VLYCVLQLYSVISTHTNEQFLSYNGNQWLGCLWHSLHFCMFFILMANVLFYSFFIFSTHKCWTLKAVILGFIRFVETNWNQFQIRQFYAFVSWIWNQFRETIETCSGDGFADKYGNYAVVYLTAVDEITVEKYNVFIQRLLYYILCG